MMRMWRESYAVHDRAGGSAALSAVLHVVALAVWVAATAVPAGLVTEYALSNRPYYLPPPERTRGSRGMTETLRYVELAPALDGAGTGSPAVGDGPANASMVPDGDIGDLGRDLAATVASLRIDGADSTYTVFQVEIPVAFDPASAGPRYPDNLLQQQVEGSVQARYVVDTTGFPVPGSFRVLKSSHREFVDAVIAALPGMRFLPAKIGDKSVRQLVEQEFKFRIRRAPTDTVAVSSASRPPT